MTLLDDKWFCYNLIMILSTCQRLIIFKVLRTIWLDKGNQYEFLKHPKIKWLDAVVEQWTGNPEAGGSSSPSNHLIFGCLRNLF